MARFALTGFVISLAWLSASVPSQAAQVIDLDEAIALALQHNDSVLQAQVSADLAELDIGDARSRFLPTLTLDASGLESRGRNFSEREGRIVDDTIRSTSLSAASGLPLFNGFGDVAATRRARLSSQAWKLDLQRARESVVAAVSADYFRVISAREQLRVQQESLTAETELERQIRVYVEGGSRSRADLYTQQVSVANARLAVTEAMRTAEQARMSLLDTIGIPAGFEYDVVAAGNADPAGDSSPEAVEELVAQALARRADLAAQTARVQASEQGIRVAKAGHWPSIALGAGYGSGYTDASSFSSGEQLDMNRGSTVGIGISMPLFDGGRTRRAVRRAELLSRNAGIALNATRLAVEQQVRRAHLDYRVACQQLALAETGRQAAGLALDIEQDRYRLGTSSLVELSQARAALTQAESLLVEGRYQLRLRRALLDYASGTRNRQEPRNMR